MCNWIKWIFAGAYVIALLLFALRALDLIALERDYISGGFLLVLGLPWTLFLSPWARSTSSLVFLRPYWRRSRLRSTSLYFFRSVRLCAEAEPFREITKPGNDFWISTSWGRAEATSA